MKPASRNRFLRAALAAAASAAAGISASTAAVEIPTSFGQGADTYLSNDGNAGPTVNHGAKGGVEVRNFEGTRLRVALLRFDIGGLAADSDNTGATLRLTQSYGNNRSRNWTVYGLRDGHAGEAWPETTTHYDNAPGVNGPGAANATYSIDIHNVATNPTGAWEPLAVQALYPISTTSGPTLMSGINLKDFIDADTNGVVTFLLVTTSDNSQTFGLASKEDASRAATDRPHLILPNGSSGDSDNDGLADGWEMLHFGNLDQRGTDDPDGDGHDNLAEQAAGSDPKVAASTPLDIDADGLPDLWEDLHFGNNDGISTAAERLLQNGAGDPDGDLNPNLAELANSTDPNDRNSFLDSDSDGLNDFWERLYFNDDLTVATSTTGDNDGDSHNNLAEYHAGSNPNNAPSIPGDIDGDTLGDAWETQYFGNLNVTNDPLGDPDEDGFTNKQEESSTPIQSNPVLASSVPGDSDGDGLSDLWELNYFSSVTESNGLHDPDGDLYTNAEEQANGTDPLDNMSFVDSDEDSLNDRWEMLHFGSLTVASDPDDDADSDGFNNQEEYDAGSSPSNDKSVPEDTDGDGLADSWELLFFPDIHHADGSGDPDRDFSTNLEEFAANTSPIDRAISPDSDFDGLGDGWEIFSFGAITATDDTEGDADGDGFSNAAEYAAASHGNDPVSTPDTDGDGLPDGWELLHFGSIAAQNGGGDPDGDGANNALELLAKTLPMDNTSTPNPAIVTTAFGRGADTSLSNDVQNATTGPNNISGNAVSMTSRDNRASRLHIPMMRFDVSQLGGDLANTALRLNVTFGSPASAGVLEVFGLIDGDSGEGWVEGSTNYLNAPGIIEADRGILNIWSRHPQRARYLGTIQVPGSGVAISNPATLNLKSFIEADKDGQITLFLRAPANRWYGLSTKEQGDVNLSPALIAPLGEIVTPVTLEITEVAFDTVANQFTMTVAGLAVGASYHVQSMVGGQTTFQPVAGSTFTATEPTRPVTVAADEIEDPRGFFRVATGVAP